MTEISRWDENAYLYTMLLKDRQKNKSDRWTNNPKFYTSEQVHKNDLSD